MAEGAPPELVLDAAGLRREVARVGAAVSADHPDGVVLVGLLKGSVLLLADLARRLTVPARLDLVAVTAYDGTEGRIRVVKDLDRTVAGQPVVLVTGIVDTGFTADYLRRHLEAAGATSIRIATVADKSARRLLPVEPDYAVVAAPDRFLVGYGLDYRGRYRNLPDLWAVDGDDLVDRPDRHVTALYGPPGSDGGTLAR